ncbi:MAG: hypothetical protein JO340_10885 [Acidobacteriaceae bacterium]|nr:hypothetical protein [Acidobacteriaceae bacterium]
MSFPRLHLIIPITACLCSHALLASTVELTNIHTFSPPFEPFLGDVAINDNGEIAGTSFSVPSAQPAGFVIPANGGAPVQIKYPGAQYTYVNGINNQGTVTGFAFTGTSIVGFTENGGTFTTLNTAFSLTFAQGINNNGDIAGWWSPASGGATAFFIKNGVQGTFSVPGYPYDTYATAINDSGQIAGYFNYATDGFLRNADGSLTYFGFAPNGLNNAGIIVGSGDGPNDTSIGEIRLNGVSYTYEYPGSTAGTYLYGINNSNEVIGFDSTNNGYTETIFEGQLQFVSAPEPSTGWLCVLALAGFVVVRFRRRREQNSL